MGKTFEQVCINVVYFCCSKHTEHDSVRLELQRRLDQIQRSRAEERVGEPKRRHLAAYQWEHQIAKTAERQGTGTETFTKYVAYARVCVGPTSSFHD